ncbi:STAS domain-containing protein [Alkalihalobacillus oceani]|uniref:STAS domain-containing protein n=1 Tax=Halalkalibacter oceani TaxID=1653776 RepID=A0A9X2DT70_9BACI|nr:STAS domain-containing protein [Halalkalibacter oceani]MCM3716519.1 STAS domain-containing protein [Halalkalibacter oceani]
MEKAFIQQDNVADFITANRDKFEEKLLSEAVNVAKKINDILIRGNIDLMKNAEKLVLYVIDQDEEKLIEFANVEGMAWAKHALTLEFKLEWVQAIRRTVWYFLEQFDRLHERPADHSTFYQMERVINDTIDQFLNHFFISYSNYKDELLNSQRKLVENLSVPIIPVSDSVAVLPLIGMIDSSRMRLIEEKVLTEISKLRITTLIIDLSGIANMQGEVIDHLQKVLYGVKMMGSKAIMTGLRPELVRNMIHLGISFEKFSETKGTLQQTLKDYLS